MEAMKMTKLFSSRLTVLIGVLALSCGPGVVLAKELCKENPQVVGSCFTVHGRLSLYNGNPGIRIWWIGTKRILGVTGGEGEETLPQEMKDQLADNVFVYGDFLVCAFTKERAGYMRYVCIESGKNLIVRKIPMKPIPSPLN
jgi:hypothetical protein